ncbi:hypothetical protein N8586_05715 [Verrucomicrobiales bacterium]|nr:hypothetical protein [Verrucomicrobiales bacterium]
MDAFRLVMVSLAGWVNQQQAHAIEGTEGRRERLEGLLCYYYGEAV